MTIDRAAEILAPDHREHYDGMEEVNEACRMGMETLKRQKWIPCSERLPDVKQRVLFWAASSETIYAGYYRYVGQNGTVLFLAGKSIYGAKYWMPLPEPPEEGGDENAAD